MYAKLTTNQINLLKLARTLDDETRATMRKEIFALVKTQYNIPVEHKLKVEIDDQTSPDFAVLIRKKDNSRYPLNANPISPVGAQPLTPSQPAPAPRPPSYRWFEIDLATIVENYYADALDWDDGITDFEDVMSIVVIDGYTCTIVDGSLYVHLREDQL